MDFSRRVLVLFLLSLFWVVLIFVAPFSLPANTVRNLDGSLGFSHDFSDLSVPWNSLYSFGDLTCHQMESRSFVFNNNQMPYCSRCTAIFVGLSIGLFALIFINIKADKRFLYLFAVACLPLIADAFGQLFGFWDSNNIVRVLTGLPAGIICGVTIGMFVEKRFLHPPETLPLFPKKVAEKNRLENRC